MTGMSISEFMDKIYHGDEIEFKIGDITYFIQGNHSGEKYYLTVDYWIKSDGSEPPHDYLLSVECDNASDRIQKFEKANIFNGKTFYEIEDAIEVTFG